MGPRMSVWDRRNMSTRKGVPGRGCCLKKGREGSDAWDLGDWLGAGLRGKGLGLGSADW